MAFDDNQKNVIDFNKSIFKKLLTICTPLRLIGIDHFSYQRIYPNHTAIRLDTETDYGSFMIQSQSFDKYSFIADFLESNKMIFMSNLNHYPSQVQSLLKEGFLIADIKQFYAIYTYNHISNYIEGCAVFKTKSYDDAFQRFDLLDKFKQYFLIEASDILSQIEQEDILLNTSISSNKCGDQHKKDNDFLKLITPNKMPLKVRDSVCYLTKKEAMCLKYLTEGYSVKEIAILQNNSPRTIENHIYHIKEKSNNSGLHIIKESFRQNRLSLLLK